MKSLSVSERKLLLIQTFDILAYSLAGLFVTVFFFAQSDLATTALFRVVAFFSMTVFFGLSGVMLRYVSSGTLIKAGLFGGALFYLLLFWLREQSVAYFVPLGILDGFAGAVFWAGFNLNQYILSSKGRRIAYFGWGQATLQFASAVGPVLGGFIINAVGKSQVGVMGGYVTLFLLVSLIIVLAAVVVGKLPGHEMPDFSYRHFLDHQRSRGWKLVLGQQAALGLYDMSLGTVTSVLFYLIIQNETQLGFVFTVGSLIATVSSVVVTRALVKFPSSFWVGAIGSAASIAVFALMQNVMGIWLCIVISGFTVPFLFTKLSAVYFDALDEAQGMWINKYHMMIERDCLLGFLRMMSYLLLYVFLSFGDQITLARFFLFILPFFPLGIGVLLHFSARTKSSPMPSQCTVPGEVI